MFRFVFVVLVALECSVLFASAECDILKCDLPKHYRELACEPTKYADNDTEKCCPIEYNCDALMSQDATKCHYKGQVYSNGDTIKTEDEPNCQANCICQDGHFRCASVECPEQVFNRPEPHCVIQNTADKCCSSSIICDQPVIDALPSCYLNGKQYRKGQKMYPEGHRCFSCICDEGFDNSTAISKNSACSEVFCDIELHKSSDIRTGCVPVYYGEPTCCPIATKCRELF